MMTLSLLFIRSACMSMALQFNFPNKIITPIAISFKLEAFSSHFFETGKTL